MAVVHKLETNTMNSIHWYLLLLVAGLQAGVSRAQQSKCVLFHEIPFIKNIILSRVCFFLGGGGATCTS